MSKEYEAALIENAKATKIYFALVDAYRSRKIGDAEYLAGRAIFKAAQKQFDLAFAKEAGWWK